MPKTLIADNLSLRTTADPASDVLQDVSLFVKDEEGKHTAIKDQSDGVRQLGGEILACLSVRAPPTGGTG